MAQREVGQPHVRPASSGQPVQQQARRSDPFERGHHVDGNPGDERHENAGDQPHVVVVRKPRHHPVARSKLDEVGVGMHLVEQRLRRDLDALLCARRARRKLEERLVHRRRKVAEVGAAGRRHLGALVETDELRHRNPVMVLEDRDHLGVADDELDFVVQEQRVDGREEHARGLLRRRVEVVRGKRAAHDSREERRNEIERLAEDDHHRVVFGNPD